MYLNDVKLILTLGRDAESKQVGERNVINFTGATTRKWRDAQGNEQEHTDWVNCKYWVKSSKVAQYLTKGRPVFVQGNLETERWEKDGNKYERVVVNVQDLQLMPQREQGDQQAQPAPQPQPQGESPYKPTGDPDLPF